MTEHPWPFGTGGDCGEQFAATRDKMLGDVERLGDIRAAVDHWRETGFLGEWAQIGDVGVLTEDDMKRMDRALRHISDGEDDAGPQQGSVR